MHIIHGEISTKMQTSVIIFMSMAKTSLSVILKENEDSFYQVVAFNAFSQKLLLLDFTDGNQALTDEILLDTTKFSEYVEQKLKNAGARYGIGGYGEHRTIYSRSNLFNAGDNEEPRRFHLGTDIWGKVGASVAAPIEGKVHSFAFNDLPGDYGTTIILSHRISGIEFFTLYGHLALSSIKNLEEGRTIYKGEVFATIGDVKENGHWPPHLHFQLIEDMTGWKGDYPGVCRFSERSDWLANCPDPDLILKMNRYLI